MITSPLGKRYFQAGQCVFSQGDPGDYAYIIDEGEIKISTIIHQQEIVLNVLKSGNMFGELALIDGRPRTASAYAKTDVSLTIVTREQVGTRIQQAEPILRLFFMVIMDYFRSETKRRISPKLTENYQDDLLDNNLCDPLKREAIELIRLESELRNAIEKKELKLFYQSIVDLKTLEIVGFEVLLRWQCRQRGYISPNLFIPLAESTSLIIPIGEWAIQEAIKAILDIKKQTNKDVFMSINIAQRQIESKSLLPFLRKEVREANIKFNQIRLEILERSLFAGETALWWLKSCRSSGFPLVIDDFGTAYANIAYLKHFQFDTIKIDKCFIDEIETSQKDRHISHSLINLSQGLDMTVVAEGIETLSQAKILRNLGCNFGQGYFFSKPVPLEEAIALIKSSPIKNQFGSNS